jgi:HAD superfamily hydrolase (TIGR01548 family)
MYGSETRQHEHPTTEFAVSHELCSNNEVKSAMKSAVPPKILIFDVDGVLVDVRGTFWRSALQTVRQLSGKRVTYAELHRWKAKPGYNDDWRMTADWVTSLGRPTSYEEARGAFEKFYWGINGVQGNVHREKFFVSPLQIEKWAQRFELNLFTGRTRKEFSFTFDRHSFSSHFRSIVTMDDVERIKPHPEGLLKILGKREPASALYIGDNVDDAVAARSAAIPFIAILPPETHGYRERSVRFRKLGALAILPKIRALDGWLQRNGIQ